MKRTLLALLCLLPIPATAQTANYSGIWQISTRDYVSIHQKGSEIIAAILNRQENGGVWEASSGTLVGSTVTIRTIYGYADTVFDVVFTSPTTFTATLRSCTSLHPEEVICLPTGVSMTAIKLF